MFIYSTLPFSVDFPVYASTGIGAQQILKYIPIKGGSQLSIVSGIGFETPVGVRTQISDDDYAELQKNSTFQSNIR